ncbi:glycosyltransferase family 2 protein [Roseovarius nanhaiticus]|uniref:glycosyltransferase family 2 protein n=1 Tax=Roseovarius nanhaiticus TaxID=573024 RepID=UPI00249367D0|nr:glycosyltransferase family 2 protein [Roseovarius nanhaiticus]
MTETITWGLVSTIKAPAEAILNFAAYHLELGAHCLHIYLDEDCPKARRALRAHPNCRVTVTNEAYWAKRRQRPVKHQARQTANATRAYRRDPGVDWLGHIDVDEFLVPGDVPLAAQLATLAPDIRTARIRPIEALAQPGGGAPQWFKGCHPRQSPRNIETENIYPTYGALLNGGFLSHVAGKIFVRTGAEEVSLRIHNAFGAAGRLPNDVDLDGTRLCHLHAPSYDAWQRAYRYRLAAGSYRPDLQGPSSVPTTMNALFTAIEEDGGEEALRRFYDEVCTATPELRTRLEAHGHLHRIDLNLDAARARVFPQAG